MVYNSAEETRVEVKQFLEEYGLTSKHMAKVLGWDYTTFVKFKNGREEISEQRQRQVIYFIRRYKEIIKLM